jgi:hypothetical protein
MALGVSDEGGQCIGYLLQSLLVAVGVLAAISQASLAFARGGGLQPDSLAASRIDMPSFIAATTPARSPKPKPLQMHGRCDPMCPDLPKGAPKAL